MTVKEVMFRLQLSAYLSDTLAEQAVWPGHHFLLCASVCEGQVFSMRSHTMDGC